MIQKVWVKNKEKKGGTMQWLPHVDKLVLEWLANRCHHPAFKQTYWLWHFISSTVAVTL